MLEVKIPDHLKKLGSGSNSCFFKYVLLCFDLSSAIEIEKMKCLLKLGNLFLQ